MTLNTKRYHLRLLARTAFYDDLRTHMFWNLPEGKIISDPAEIAMLEARKAPVERIETKLSPRKEGSPQC